jgi:alkanesulfonate monooxygenase SsuD/methylene tetrahydromethanopterin reductase-like flavin-dependent oxidoreductase (luciferase family)
MRVDVGHPLKLGLFPPNVSGGMTPTLVHERWQPNWGNNIELALLAEDAGFEFFLPASRWIGYGGDTGFQREVYETVTLASALLARTRRITVFCTVHVPLLHPIFAAMQMATADNIGHGRLGLNLVCGWRKDEFEMFGIGFQDGTDLYDMGEEWLTIVRRLWSEIEPFDFSGKFFQLASVQGLPKPCGGTAPVVMNAAASPRGRRFAVEYADFLFTNIYTADESTRSEIADFKTQRAAPVGVCVCACVVCRRTRREAELYYDYYSRENADWGAIDEIVRLMGAKVAEEDFDAFRAHVAGAAGVYPIVGDPDDVAQELARLHTLGFDGVALGWVNYLDELPFFRDEVIPRLEELGVRHSDREAAPIRT